MRHVWDNVEWFCMFVSTFLPDYSYIKNYSLKRHFECKGSSKVCNKVSLKLNRCLGHNYNAADAGRLCKILDYI